MFARARERLHGGMGEAGLGKLRLAVVGKLRLAVGALGFNDTVLFALGNRYQGKLDTAFCRSNGSLYIDHMQ